MKGAPRHSVSTAFANQKRASCLAATRFARISEEFFTCYLAEDTVTETRDREIARLTRHNMLGLLDGGHEDDAGEGPVGWTRDHER